MRRFGIACLLACACSFDRGGVAPGDETDAARDDAARHDAAPPGDAAPPDAAPPGDAAPPDAAPPDAVPPDAALPDACVPAPFELCNGIDDTCDALIDEGFMLGVACDGGDADLCNEGVFVCDGMGGSACSDASGDTVELCNGADDDCDASIDEGFMLGVACDGADADLCNEGVFVCDGMGGSACSDASGDSVESCNGADDDCDLAIDEDFDLTSDEANCGACGTVCQLANATSNTCTGSTCVPMCVAGAQNCDGDGTDGCELRNTNPLCSGAIADLGDVSGDSASAMDTIMTSGFAETIVQARVTEDVFGTVPLTVRVDLASPPGVDFDLRVYCATCGSAALQTSTLGPGMTDTVFLGRDDIAFVDASYDIVVEITFASATACGTWTLTIDGAVATSNRTCN